MPAYNNPKFYCARFAVWSFADISVICAIVRTLVPAAAH